MLRSGWSSQSSMRSCSRSKAAASSRSSRTISPRALPGSTLAPRVEVRAARGTSARSSTNWPAGTSTARRSARRAGELHVAAHRHRVPPRAQHAPRTDERRCQPAEPRLPLVAPDLEVDVHHVVVGDREAAKPVLHAERALLEAGAEVPDDADAVVELLDPVGVRQPERAELGRRARPVRGVALAGHDVVDRLAVAKRDLAERAGEVPREVERDAFVDEDRTVARELYLDVGLRQRERLRGRLGGRDQRGERRDDEEQRASAQNWTRGASRAAVSISKNCLESNPNVLATRLVGTLCRRVLVGEHGVVVDLARHLDPVLRLLQLPLQVPEVVAGAELRVCLGDREQPADGGREEVLGLRLLRDAGRLLRGRARTCDLLERCPLVRRVALDRLHEVRDEVVAAAELHVDLGPRVVHTVAQADELVVDEDDRQREHDDDDDGDDRDGHGATLRHSAAGVRRVAAAPARPCRLRRGRAGDRTSRRGRPPRSRRASSSARHSGGESQASTIVAAPSIPRTDSVSVRALRSHSARSQIPGSRSSQRRCVCSMSSSSGSKTSKASRPPGRSSRRAAPKTARRSSSACRWSSDLNGHVTSATASSTGGSRKSPSRSVDEIGHPGKLCALAADVQHPRRGVDADHAHAGGRRRHGDPSGPDPELEHRAARLAREVDVEVHVLRDAAAPWVVEPRDRVVRDSRSLRGIVDAGTLAAW